MTTSYVVPQALVYQEFTTLPEALAQPLRACVVGPNYQLVTDNVNGLLGTYDPFSDICYSWPNRAAGGVVDQDWTRVFIDDALLQYFYNPSSGGDTIQATYCQTLDLMSNSEIKNAIRSDATNWKTYGAYARDVELKNRDVKLGDTVKVSAVVDAELVTLWSYIAGFINEKIDGSVGTAYRDSSDTDYPFDTSSSASPAIIVTKIGFGTNTVDITTADKPAEEPEQGYIDGVRKDDYLLEVIEAGEPAATVIRVTSSSGTDDVDSLTPSDWGVSTPFGNKGLAITFTRSGGDVFELGMAWEISVQFGAVVVYPKSGGTYSGPSDSTYVITVSKGGMFGGSEGNPEITVTTTTGIDVSGPHEMAALSTPIEIGTYGVEIEFTSSVGYRQGLYLGDKFYVPVVAPTAGAVRTLVLGHNLPAGLLGLDEHGTCGTPPDLAVTLYIKKDVEVEQDRAGYAPLVNWTTSATEICLASGILAYDSTWVDDYGTMLPLPVKSGSAWVYYRALRTAQANLVGSISDITTVSSILGTVSVYNPLAFGVYMALLNSSGEEVKYVGVSSDDLAGYTAALNKLVQRNDVYSITPLTFDEDIQDLVAAHCLAMSTPENGRWRRAIISTQLLEESGILVNTATGDAYLATITDDPSTTGTQYTMVEFATTSTSLLTSGVRAGDILRAVYTTDGFGNETYSEYTIDAVLSEDSLRLVSGPDSPVNTASKVEIWRNLTADEQAVATAASGARFASRRVTNVWPDYYEKDGVLTAGYFAACAFAGLRSATVPQRSLTNIALAGIDTVTRTTDKFTEDQLNVLAAAGTMIITQSLTGEIYIRHNLTTDMTDAKTREESITANLDSVSYIVLDQIAPFIGSSNLTDETINQIDVEIKDIIEYLRNNSVIPTVGGQLISGTITKIERHPTLSDRLVVVLDLVLPEPMNNVEVHLVV